MLLDITTLGTGELSMHTGHARAHVTSLRIKQLSSMRLYDCNHIALIMTLWLEPEVHV